ncbi:MAG: hypothetical protein JOZ52_07920 [Acidobacteria bacterium]|nr:hypothetical protein [Acidobacteriota bacterium]
MSTVAGIFSSRADAERAADNLRSLGLTDKEISLLAPGTSHTDIDTTVPTTETEQPGMGSALGGVVGGAMGAAGGATMGAAVASLLVPGVGPVIAAGIIGAALLGAGGAAVGATAGDALEDTVEGLPHDELYVYEDALRKGHTVVIASTTDEAQSEAARNVLSQAGAESIDAAREEWWVGLRDAEQEQYTEEGKDFAHDEPLYRKGFESSLHSQARGKTYQERQEFLHQHYGDDCTSDAFKCGYDRGQSYQRELRERY